MAQISRPWAGIVTGDAGPYSDVEWEEVWAAFQGPNYRVADVNHLLFQPGVFKGQLNELAATVPGANQVTIASGRAMVDGKWYQNDAPAIQAIPTEAANDRIDRIVLRKDFILQTIVLTVIPGVPGIPAAAPALVQNAGVQWDLPLWQVYMALGVALPVLWRDERDFIGQYEPHGLSDAEGFYEDDFLYYDYVNGESRGPWEVYDTGAGNVVSSVVGGAVGAIGFQAFADNVIEQIASGWLEYDTMLARLKFRARTPATDANLYVRAGFLDANPTQAAPNPVNGIYFRHDGAGNWFAINRAGGVEAGTATDTLVAPANVWRQFEIIVRAGEIEFKINEALVAVHVANFPATTLRMLFGNANSAAPGGLTEALTVDSVKLRGVRS